MLQKKLSIQNSEPRKNSYQNEGKVLLKQKLRHTLQEMLKKDHQEWDIRRKLGFTPEKKISRNG